MAQKLPADVLQNRLREYVANHYLMLISVIKGVVLYAAGYTLLAIVKNPANVVPRLALWLASLAGALFYVTWARGMVLTNEKYNLGDAIWPLAMGIVEILLFAILAPDNASPLFWWNWYLIFAAHSFCAFLLIGNRLRQTDAIADYDGSLKSESGKSMQDLAVEYEGWVENDHRVTRGFCIVGVVVWAVMRWVVLPRWQSAIQGQALLGLIAFAALLKAAHGAVCQRTRIDEFTTSLLRVSDFRSLDAPGRTFRSNFEYLCSLCPDHDVAFPSTKPS